MNDPKQADAVPAPDAELHPLGAQPTEVVFSLADERPEPRPAPRRRAGLWWLLALLLLGLLAWWLLRPKADLPSPPVVSAPMAPAPVAVSPPPQPTPAPTVTAPPPTPDTSGAVQNPIDDAAKPVAGLPALDASDPVVRKALLGWLGDKTVDTLLRSDDFVRRFVVTVDNLGREHAAPRLWPINPAPRKFMVQRRGDGEVIAPENAARYQAVIALATSMDPARAATLYRQHYPLFQQAYRDLGYPSGYFNDRLVQVIDRLLATPEPAQPPLVRRVEIKGEMAATMPTSNFYEFADPSLDKLAAGQKAMLRMGNDHMRKVKSQLRAFRAAIAKTS